jgi:hypothetical protein
MFADERGMAVQPIRPLAWDRQTINRLRDITIIKMRSRNVPLRAIGAFLGVDKKTIQNRLSNIPVHVYEHYRKSSLGELGGALIEGAEA